MVTISALYYLFRLCIDTVRRRKGRDFVGDVVYLTYHAIKPEQRAKFALQMNELRRVGEPVFADFRPDKAECGRRIAVTFDDGFMSVLDNALPILVEKNIPATIFVPAGYLGKRAGWISARTHSNFSEEVLSIKELGKLPPELISIGSHTVSHSRLTTLDESRLMDELMNSRTILEQVVKRSVVLLSYPYGAHNRKVETLSHKAGYHRVFSNVPVARTRNDDFLVGRIDVTLDDWLFEYRLKLLGAYQWLALAIVLKHKMTYYLNLIKRLP